MDSQKDHSSLRLLRRPSDGRRLQRLNFGLFLLSLAAACIYLAPYVGSESMAGAPPFVELTKDQKQKREIDAFFDGPIVHLSFEIVPEQLERLKKDQRNYAEATMREGSEESGRVYKGVAIKLKGSAGSFQGIEGKPGMTLNLDKFKGAERFHGMKKFHLNNSVQDGTYLHELIAGEMARKAGVPASRCTHVFVELNGRDLGVYVLKEAFTKDFLAGFYAEVDGDLYDGGFCRDLTEEMEKDQGDPKDKRAMRDLIGACAEADPVKRWELLSKLVDVDRFAAYAAFEAFLCHWDGYSFNRNNYRVYQDPGTGKMSFLLHGMDQTFNDVNFPLMRDFSSTLGTAFMRCPEGKRLYREKLESLYASVLAPGDWQERVTKAGERLSTALAEKKPGADKDFQGQIATVRNQVSARLVAIGKQLSEAPKPIVFDANGAFNVAQGWRTEGGAAQIDETQDDGKACLHIKAGGEAVASWRKNLALEPGRYRFEARVRTTGVTPARGDSGEGAGVRISGGNRNGKNGVVGDAEWQTVGYDFESQGNDVVLVAELRANKGEVWFENDSLRVVRVK